MVALQPLPPLVARNLQRQAVLWPELLQLRHHARRYDGFCGGEEGVHEGGEQVEFVLDRVREEVCVDEDLVGRGEGGVVGEEHGGRGLGDLADHRGGGGDGFADGFAFVLVLFAGGGKC